MYYDRTITNETLAKLLLPNGKLRWLFDLVKSREDLDFLIGANNAKQWISIYRGLSRVITITPRKDGKILLDAAVAYKEMLPTLYGVRAKDHGFRDELLSLIENVASQERFDRYYNNRKEGFYQNELSRLYGICGQPDDDFVIIDKEAVIGYSDQEEKTAEFNSLQKPYKQLHEEISKRNPKRYGRDLCKKAMGNELDFLALDRQGNLKVIEYKHGTNTSGIYLSPLQIGLYDDIFRGYPREELIQSVSRMLQQKKDIGLIHPEWHHPAIKRIIPVLIISEYNERSSARAKFQEIIEIVRSSKRPEFMKDLEVYDYRSSQGLTKLDFMI